jgi:Concanavalin A-like lectin/glucanases superfamily
MFLKNNSASLQGVKYLLNFNVYLLILNQVNRMKFLKTILVAGFLATLFITGGSSLSSCKKEIERDTIIIRDTIIKKDTIRITDSVCYDLKDSLVAWYKFTGGSLKDSSGKNNDIVFNNATATADRFGKANNAYLFNGTSSYMSVSNSSSLNPQSTISIMAIVQVKGFYAGTCHANNILSKGWNDFVNGFYSLRFSDFLDCNGAIDPAKQIFFSEYGNNGSGRTGASSTGIYVQKEKWVNLIFTYGKGESNFYIDGVLVDNRKGQNPSFTPNGLDLTIGKHGDPQYPYWFNGVMDEIRIYNKVLCDGEVRALNKLKD